MPEIVPCPYCAEPIRLEAVKCRHCREWLDERALERQAGRGGTTVVVERSNTLPALASFFVPGLGQLIQGRLLPALAFFAVATLFWVFSLAGLVGALAALCFAGPAVHIWAAIDAARWSD